MQKDQKKVIITTHQAHKKDTGSSRVQIAILTDRIQKLAAHFQLHKQDNHSRRGLLRMVGRRRKLLQYLRINKPLEYKSLIKDLKLRK